MVPTRSPAARLLATARERPPDIRLRRATPRDKGAVEEICGKGDYVPDIFDHWVPDRRGGLWVATIRDRAIGLAKLTLLGDHEAWLHGLRVHPRYRRRGVARALLSHRLERARLLGARVARLDTHDDNTAVRRLMRRFGFRIIGHYTFWRTAAHPGTAPRRAEASELVALRRLARAGDGILHERFVRRALSRPDLASAVRRGRCLVAGPVGRPAALTIVDPMAKPFGKTRGPAQRRLRVTHLAGTGRALRELVAALPAEAERRGLEGVSITASIRTWPALRAARYDRPWTGSMPIYEKRL